MEARVLEEVEGHVVVALELLNMTRVAHHHFDFAKDGHSRVYDMAFETSSFPSSSPSSSPSGDPQAVPPPAKGAPSDASGGNGGQEASKSPAGVVVRVKEAAAAGPPPAGVGSFAGAGVQPGEAAKAADGNWERRLLGQEGAGWRRYESGQLWLVRRDDGWKIPYWSLRSVSLIALLRMGLGKAHKARLYSIFARMPLYEDMAPWNIVAQGSSLQYIDQVKQLHCSPARIDTHSPGESLAPASAPAPGFW